MDITERFLNYTKFDTQSQEDSDQVPSTEKQLVFANYLKKELESEGLSDVEMDDKGYIYATLKANVKGDIPTRNVGALVAWEDGVSTSYALFNIQDRGELFIEAGVKVYNGMIIGRNSRPGDIDVNVCKKKHMTNSRNSAAAEEALKITGVHIPTLEEAMEFIDDDELVEITPKSIRMRKRILGTEARKKLEARKKNG